MNEQDFQTRLTDLMTEISTLPAGEREKMARLAQQTQQQHDKTTQAQASVQESLDYLRLSIKYMVFDLEATRRENGFLRKMLEQAANKKTEA